jgi:hypothetical protein
MFIPSILNSFEVQSEWFRSRDGSSSQGYTQYSILQLRNKCIFLCSLELYKTEQLSKEGELSCNLIQTYNVPRRGKAYYFFSLDTGALRTFHYLSWGTTQESRIRGPHPMYCYHVVGWRWKWFNEILTVRKHTRYNSEWNENTVVFTNGQGYVVLEYPRRYIYSLRTLQKQQNR